MRVLRVMVRVTGWDTDLWGPVVFLETVERRTVERLVEARLTGLGSPGWLFAVSVF